MNKTGLLSADALQRARQIEAILMDVDGVMTAGMIVYDANGLEIKHFNAHDGLGIKMAHLAGLKTGIISARQSGTVRKRASEIGIDFLYLGHDKKLPAFDHLQKEVGLRPEKFCFIGDDLPDLPVLRKVGLAVAVRNATGRVKEEVHYITQLKGGEGAVREVVEVILEARGLLEAIVSKLLEQE